jgi:hypothetical protein
MRKIKKASNKKYGIYYSDIEYNSEKVIIEFGRKACVEAWLTKPRKAPEDYIVVIRPENPTTEKYVYLNGFKFLSLMDNLSDNFDSYIQRARLQ